MVYQLQTEKFSGPIEKLLELIEERKLEITEFNLASVTADFLEYLKTVEQTNPRLLADFVVVASKLLLIKSKSLLPNIALSPEEEKDIKDLEVQIQFYQKFKPAINHLRDIWEAKNFSVSRQLLAGRPVVFYPSENIKIEKLEKVMNVLFEALNQFAMEVKTIKSPLVSLEEKIKEIIGFFEKALGPKTKEKPAALNFKELKKEKDKSEVIVMFLAILHLIQQQIVKVEQSKKFSDIIIEKI